MDPDNPPPEEEERPRKRRKRVKTPKDAKMNMTPMIDVVFLLIVFFMLVTEMSKMDMMKKHMMEDMGMSEAEVTAKMAEMKEKLPDVKAKCICATCPSYVEGETELGFCHLMVGKSDKITERKGCDCPQCPVYKMMELEFGYYCIQGSEMELKMAKA